MPEDSSAKYYQDNKERLNKKLVKDIKVFQKKKKQQYGHERYKNLPENEKQKLFDYRKNTTKQTKNFPIITRY